MKELTEYETDLINEKEIVESHIKDLTKNELKKLVNILAKIYCLNREDTIYFNYLINKTIKFNLFDYIFNRLKKI